MKIVGGEVYHGFTMVLPILESNTSDQLAPLAQALAIFQEYRDSRGEWIALLGDATTRRLGLSGRGMRMSSY